MSQDPNRDTRVGNAEKDGRVPVSIREPSSGRGVVQDPIADEIVSNDRLGSTEDSKWGGKIGTMEVPETEVLIGAVGNVGRRQPDPAHASPQIDQMEEGEDGEDLRNLFEDPEFPPGFEPSGGETELEVDPDESYVKEEARQTLKLAKELGCTVSDEGHALGNLEDIIREQRAYYCQRCQEAKGGPEAESDQCSQSTSRGNSRREPGPRKGLLEFSKSSRVSMAVSRDKSRSKSKV